MRKLNFWIPIQERKWHTPVCPSIHLAPPPPETVSQAQSSTKIEKSYELLFKWYLGLNFCFNDKFSFSVDDVIKNVRNPYDL